MEDEWKPIIVLLENYVDATVSREEYDAAVDGAGQTYFAKAIVLGSPEHTANSEINAAVHNGAHAAAVGMAVGMQFHPDQEPSKEVAVSILRCIFGNPFKPVTAPPSWLAWNGGTVLNMAKVIYAERRFNDLPILADALEEAGCTDEAVLEHCRSGGEHVRGCWVVDLLLGKA